MRFFIGMLCCAAIAAVSFGQGNDKEEPNKDVQLKVTFPKEAEFKKTGKVGGQVGEIKITVEITNKGKEPITVSAAYFSVKLPNLMGDVKRLSDALQLQPGKTIKQERTITFHTVLPKDGDEVVVEFHGYGYKNVGKLKAKITD